MSINSTIISALSPLGYEISPVDYIGNEEDYFTFNSVSRGTYFCDDAPDQEIFFVQVHFWCPNDFDPIDVLEQAKQSLFAAGATWPSVTNASDADRQHHALEFELIQEVDAYGEL